MKKFILLIAACFLLLTVNAQDPHFTQYFASPLSLNPANTGFFDGKFRFALHERQQWFNVGSNYSTTSIAGDVKIMQDDLPQNDIFAIGVMGLFDNSLGGALQSNYFSGSAAYHKSLDYDGRQMLTLGMQYTYANIHLDYNRLTFASQFNGSGFDPTLPTGVAYTNSFANYSDINMGLLYSFHLKNFNMYAGASLYHILKPQESLFYAESKIPYRKTIHTGGELNLSPSSSIVISGLYMDQSQSAKDEMVGAAYGFKKQNNEDDLNFNLYVGLWLRSNATYIPYVGVDFQNYSVGLNYETTNASNTLKPATLELSLVYRTKQGTIARCPRF